MTTFYRCDECGIDLGNDSPKRVTGSFNSVGFEIITGLVGLSSREKAPGKANMKPISWNSGHFCRDCIFKAVRAVLI